MPGEGYRKAIHVLVVIVFMFDVFRELYYLPLWVLIRKTVALTNCKLLPFQLSPLGSEYLTSYDFATAQIYMCIYIMAMGEVSKFNEVTAEYGHEAM